MPAVHVPPFGYTASDNTTITFLDMIGNLGSGILVIPLISLMEDIAICKAFGERAFFTRSDKNISRYRYQAMKS